MRLGGQRNRAIRDKRHWSGLFGGGACASVRTPFLPTHSRWELIDKKWDLLSCCCIRMKLVMVRRVAFRIGDNPSATVIVYVPNLGQSAYAAVHQIQYQELLNGR